MYTSIDIWTNNRRQNCWHIDVFNLQIFQIISFALVNLTYSPPPLLPKTMLYRDSMNF